MNDHQEHNDVVDPQNQISNEPELKHESGSDNLPSEDEEPVVEKKEKKGRRKIKIEFIADKSRRHITFSKRKSGIMKKAYELSTLTGTQLLLLVASETGHVYTFATPKLQPIITKPEGKNLIQSCLNAPDTPPAPTQTTPSQMHRSTYDGGMYPDSGYDVDKKMGRIKPEGVPTPIGNFGVARSGHMAPNGLANNISYMYPQHAQHFPQQFSPQYHHKGQYLSPNVQPLQMHNQHGGEDQEN